MRRLILVALLALPLPSLAEMFNAQYQQCNQNSTVAIVDCVNAATKKWDKRLNTAYQQLMERSNPEQQAPLKATQRLWIKYRDANCGFYAAGDGSISRIQAAECLRSMTRDRTCEMEVANRMEGGPAAGCD